MDKLQSKEALFTLEIAERLVKSPLEFQPEDGWCYGASADLLGAIVEIVSKKNYRTLLKQELMSWQQEIFDRSLMGFEGFTYGNLMRSLKCKERSCLVGSTGEYSWEGDLILLQC